MGQRPIMKAMSNQQSTISNSVEQFYMNRNNYNFDIEFQRNVVWSKLQKSELIVSLLIGMYIPPLVTNKVDNELRFTDGKQRSNAILSYINGEYPLSEEINDIEIKYMDGSSKVYDLRGKYFNELPIEVSNHLKTRMIEIYQFENLPKEQEVLVIKLLNNGSVMNGIAKARLSSYDTILPFVIKLKESEFFKRKVNITKSYKDKFKLDEKVIYNLIAYECNVEISDNIEYVVSKIKEIGFSQEDRDKIVEVINYLNRSFPTSEKFLNSKNIIPIYMTCKQNMGILEERKFYEIIVNIYKDEDKDLKEIKGDWNNYKAVTERIKILSKLVDKIKNEWYSNDISN